MFPCEFGTNFIFLSIETRDTTHIEDIKMIALAVHGMKPYARCVSTALVFRLGPGRWVILRDGTCHTSPR